MQQVSLKVPYLIDIAVNLTDCVFRGVDWNGKRIHDDDFDQMLGRARANGVEKMIITGTSLAQCEKAIALCRRYPNRLLCTIGVHPANSAEFLHPIDLKEIAGIVTDETSMVTRKAFKEALITVPTPGSEEAIKIARNVKSRLAHLVDLIERNRDVVVAVGEVGIDYAELLYCPRDMQVEYFREQVRAFANLGLPFLFHSRECDMHFVEVLSELRAEWPASAPPMRGVVHSFNGSHEEQEALLSMGLSLGLNGSALRSAEVTRQVAQIPLDRLMLETDAPWCDLRPSHYGHQYVSTFFPTSKKKKPLAIGTCREGRNEPCHLVQVLEAYVGARNAIAEETEESGSALCTPATKEEVTKAVYDNSVSLFKLQ